ncbi:hypothetical protein DPEC_G00071950, partial [Dallia pectoralis]
MLQHYLLFLCPLLPILPFVIPHFHPQHHPLPSLIFLFPPELKLCGKLCGKPWTKFSKTPIETITSAVMFNTMPPSCNSMFVQGSFHQGDKIFKENAGIPCVTNSLTAVLLNKLKDVCTWK